MKTELNLAYNEVRKLAFGLEKAKEIISSIKEDNVTSVRLKHITRKYFNVCLTDLLVLTDLCYELLECTCESEVEETLRQFEEAEDDN